jgi:hypothetical protein
MAGNGRREIEGEQRERDTQKERGSESKREGEGGSLRIQLDCDSM